MKSFLKTINHALGGAAASVAAVPLQAGQHAAAHVLIPAAVNAATSAVSAACPQPNSYVGQFLHAFGGFAAVLVVCHYLHMPPDAAALQAILSGLTSSMSAGSPSTVQPPLT